MIRRSGLEYEATFIERPRRTAPRSAHALWCADAKIRIRCVRCDRHWSCAVSAAEIQRIDPYDNHCYESNPEGLARTTDPATTAMIDGHLCWPTVHHHGVDFSASQHEQYESLSVAFAKLAMEAPNA